MDDERKNPEQLLKIIQQEENNKGRGSLKIFFGYAAGVGKTYAMLKAAHAAKDKGIDVVAGYIEPHGRAETEKLINGLECIPYLKVKHHGIMLNEFNLDEAIKRKPQLILVDELAHTNAELCRHEKRYKDVEELLNAGIDVYTTVNVQHIESLNDTLAAITGVVVRERIPDSVFDRANQVELVDIEPQELIERLRAGSIYKESQAKRAVDNFFNDDNLIALRELALRRCADRVNILSENARIKNNGSYYTDEHILVCLSSSPSNAKIIRTAARMANAFRSNFTALFVETPDYSNMNDDDKKRLRSNIGLAKKLGAKIETVYGDDIPFLISEFARLSAVSKIVVGRSGVERRAFNKPTLTEKLIALAPNMDIYIIPDNNTAAALKKWHRKSSGIGYFKAEDILKSVAVILCATLFGFLFDYMGFSEANIITVYILGVLLISVITGKQAYSIISAFLSVLVFNFFFTVPKFTLFAYDKDYPITFLVMFLAAFISGSLASRLKNSARQSAQAAHRTKILFDTNQLLEKVKDKNEIINVTAEQITKLLGRDLIFYENENGKLGSPKQFPVNKDKTDSTYISDNEEAVAAWVLKNNKHAGATTDTLASAKCLYLAVRVNNNIYGVVGIVINDEPLDAFENNILMSILGECGRALENEKITVEKREATILAQKEQLRANLLRAISHDLRTPLTSISGNASNLLSNGECFDENTKKKLYSDIYDDSMWLINLVENLLSITRIEDGHINLHTSAELLEDVVSEALLHVNRNAKEHNIKIEDSEEFILAKIDARLIVQVIINIVDNAVKYTPTGSDIIIKLSKSGDMAVVSISDNGIGIPDENKPYVFDMFYSGANKIADSRRSLGLGLSLCKSIINAHGGEITVSDNVPKGAKFTFTLPLGEVELHE